MSQLSKNLSVSGHLAVLDLPQERMEHFFRWQGLWMYCGHFASWRCSRSGCCEWSHSEWISMEFNGGIHYMDNQWAVWEDGWCSSLEETTIQRKQYTSMHLQPHGVVSLAIQLLQATVLHYWNALMFFIRAASWSAWFLNMLCIVGHKCAGSWSFPNQQVLWKNVLDILSTGESRFLWSEEILELILSNLQHYCLLVEEKSLKPVAFSRITPNMKQIERKR